MGVSSYIDSFDMLTLSFFVNILGSWLDLHYLNYFYNIYLYIDTPIS